MPKLLIGLSLLLTFIGVVMFWLDINYMKSEKFYRDQDEGFTEVYHWLPWIQAALVSWIVTILWKAVV